MSSTSELPAAPAAAMMKSTNVLSDKVNRALHVRTDTPAMRAALSALASLPSSSSSSADTNTTTKHSSSVTTSILLSSSPGVIDAKSVRAAIETDALRRALQFQTELQKLARDATTLRERVDNVAKVAAHIGKIVDRRIISKEQADMLLNNNHHNHNGDESGGNSEYNNFVAEDDTTTTSSWEMERTLASRLHSAHKSYVDATHRQRAVDAFLDKFDLGENEARLLDHYNFQGFLQEGGEYEYEDSSNPWCHPNAASWINPNPSGETMEDATSFLNALERLVVIRKELSKTFGNSSSSGGGGGAGGVDSTAGESLFDYDNIGQDNDNIGNRSSSSSGQLGTNSALRMMEQLATRQERAYERLYTFIQFFLGIGSATPNSHHNVPTSSNDTGRSFSASDASQFGALGRFQDGDDMDEAFGHPVIRRGLRVLRHSPAHYVHALELIASSRRTEVTRRFLLALTSGYGGMAPLEMKAHDPVGYVGDMLAFAFRAFRVEGELVKTLFLRERESGDLEEKEQDEGYEDTADSRPMSASELLAQSMGGLSRPLKTRLSQVIMSLTSQGGAVAGGASGAAMQSNDDEDTSSSLNRLVAIYSVCGLLRFYCSAIEKALGKAQAENEVNTDSPFLTTCDECLAEAADCYVASLRAYGAMLGSHSMGSSQTEAHLAQRAITLIAEERVASPGFADDAMSFDSAEDDLVSKQLSLSFLLSTMVDAAMTHLKTLDDSSALKSGVNAASKSGLDAKETSKWMRLIDDKEQNLVELLVGTEAEIALEVCGLGAIRSGIKDMDRVYIEGMTMSSHPGLSAKEVEGAMKQFYSSLFSPPIPTFEDTIKDAQLRKLARSRTAQIVIDVYQEVYKVLTSERGGYTDLSFLEHEPNQVKALLSL
jgi:hypothetical protein